MATKTVSEITINKIRIGGKAPKKIMKGSTEVKKVTKGSTIVYQKEDITYTLDGTGGATFAASNTKIDFTVSSYKGSSTSVALSASNVSVTAGGGSVYSVENTTGYYYRITLSVSENTSTVFTKTHTIVVTQPTSGLTLTLSATQSKKGYYLQINRIGFRFSGAFPTNIFDITLNSVYINTNTGGTNLYYEDLYGTSTNPGHLPDSTKGVWYYNQRSINGPIVTNGCWFGANFSFGGTWAGSSAYSGNTMHLIFKDATSGSSYIVERSSSNLWQVGVQPTSPLGVQTAFVNINATKSIDLCIDVNWSWSGSWHSDGRV